LIVGFGLGVNFTPSLSLSLKPKSYSKEKNYCLLIGLTGFPSFKIFEKKEEETAEATFKKLKKEFELFERCFDLFMETIDCVAKSTESKLLDSEGKNATFIILPRIVQSIQSFRLLIIRGYYYDSRIIGRSLLESIGLCSHLSANEEEAIRWLHGKRIKLASIHLLDSWLHIRDDVKAKKAYEAMWGGLCNFVHTDIRGATYLIDRFSKKTKIIDGAIAGNVTFQFVSRFDKKEAKEIADIPLFATLMLEDIFQTELKPYKKRQKKSRRLSVLLLSRRKSEKETS
jgi:hypothetical protein